MFCIDFDNFSTDHIIDGIKNQGFFVFPEVLDAQYIDELLREIDFDSILVNHNDVGAVMATDVSFLTHCLACSKKAYDVITSPKVLDICRSYFTNNYKLVNHRVYRTTRNSYMPWHTDNNLQAGKQLSNKHKMPGLLFLIYLSDVSDNAFQLVKNSHKWSQEYSHEIYLSDEFIEEKYSQDIVTLPMRKGSIIICDIHTIHRAEPVRNRNFSRYTLLFQVDQVDSEYIGHGEKNLVNTDYLDNLTPEVMNYLGFGYTRNYPAFPNSSIATMKISAIWQVQKQLFMQTIQSFGKQIIVNFLPGGVIINIKRMRWKLKSLDSLK